MGNNTGLRLTNSSSNTITLNLFEQGDSLTYNQGGLKETTEASNGWEYAEGQPTDAGSRLYYYDGDLTFNQDTYINVDIDDVRLQSVVTNGRVVWDDDTNGASNITSGNFGDVVKLITDDWSTKNGVSNTNRFYISLEIQIKANADPNLLDMRFKWLIKYIIPTDQIDYLVKSIFFNDNVA